MKHFALVSCLIAACGLALWGSQPAAAQDYRAEKLAEAPPADELADEIAKQLSDSGLKVMRGASRTVCEIWLCKEWPIPAGEQSPQLLYPFQPGQLIGVVRYPRRSSDFRDQDIDAGVYTLRYGLQPVDGNHVGTSPTRDFLVVVSAEKDQSAKPMETDELHQASAETLGTTHPGILCLKKRPESVEQTPAMAHDEANDWWMLQCEGTVSRGGEKQKLIMNLIVVGAAHE